MPPQASAERCVLNSPSIRLIHCFIPGSGEFFLMPQALRSTAASEAAFAKAQKLMPGGVSSPVRAFKAVGGTPLFIKEAEGCTVTDIDGNKYIDYVGSY